MTATSRILLPATEISPIYLIASWRPSTTPRFGWSVNPWIGVFGSFKLKIYSDWSNLSTAAIPSMLIVLVSLTWILCPWGWGGWGGFWFGNLTGTTVATWGETIEMGPVRDPYLWRVCPILCPKWDV